MLYAALHDLFPLLYCQGSNQCEQQLFSNAFHAFGKPVLQSLHTLYQAVRLLSRGVIC